MNHKEYVGFESIYKLEEILKENRPRNILLVTGRHSYDHSGARRLLTPMLHGYDITRFHDFAWIPMLDDIERGTTILKRKKCDLVIAVGGGSVIDIAKLVNIFASQKLSIKEYVLNNEKITKPGNPLVAIPTTAGSGSEATHFAVVYVAKKKFSVASKYILPNYGIIDPQLTMNLPPKITASTGIDALCQAIESYWSINSTSLSRNLAMRAIRLILDNLVDAVNSPKKETRLAMSKASHLSGKAINITKTTAPHAISYSMTSYFGIPHGHAVGLTLGEFLVYNSMVDEMSATDKKVLHHFKSSFAKLLKVMGVSDSYSAAMKINELMHKIGLETKLSRLGIRAEDLEIIVDNVNVERLNNNPRIVNKKVLHDILANIL